MSTRQRQTQNMEGSKFLSRTKAGTEAKFHRDCSCIPNFGSTRISVSFLQILNNLQHFLFHTNSQNRPSLNCRIRIRILFLVLTDFRWTIYRPICSKKAHTRNTRQDGHRVLRNWLRSPDIHHHIPYNELCRPDIFHSSDEI
jgi:hypothetical protein